MQEFPLTAGTLPSPLQVLFSLFTIINRVFHIMSHIPHLPTDKLLCIGDFLDE
jgi:hypothetical protein